MRLTFGYAERYPLGHEAVSFRAVVYKKRGKTHRRYRVRVSEADDGAYAPFDVRRKVRTFVCPQLMLSDRFLCLV